MRSLEVESFRKLSLVQPCAGGGAEVSLQSVYQCCAFTCYHCTQYCLSALFLCVQMERTCWKAVFLSCAESLVRMYRPLGAWLTLMACTYDPDSLRTEGNLPSSMYTPSE